MVSAVDRWTRHIFSLFIIVCSRRRQTDVNITVHTRVPAVLHQGAAQSSDRNKQDGNAVVTANVIVDVPLHQRLFFGKEQLNVEYLPPTDRVNITSFGWQRVCLRP